MNLGIPEQAVQPGKKFNIQPRPPGLGDMAERKDGALATFRRANTAFRPFIAIQGGYRPDQSPKYVRGEEIIDDQVREGFTGYRRCCNVLNQV